MQPISEQKLPALFGRYQLLELIGRGGMAEVFKARLDAAAGTEKFVCIKRILPALSSNAEFMRLFVSEARIALPLSHGNITQVFDFGQVGDVYFLAMEYVHGQNLDRVLTSLRQSASLLDLPSSLYVATEVCRGLQYAHGYTDATGRPSAVIHRDVSPHNVLISYNGEVKLADFGIALAASKAPEREAALRGKPCYLSPEQAMGQQAGPRSDIFSLGVVLYEMLTGVRVFLGDGEQDTLQRVRTLNPALPSAVNREIDAELDGIVTKAIAKDAALRYLKADDLFVDLSRVLHRVAPDFTAASFAATVRELFAWDLQAPSENGEVTTRDRLLYQLSRAGVAVSDPSATTDKLLQMATVAIGQLDAAQLAGGKRRRSRRRPWLWWGLGGATFLIAVALTMVALNSATKHVLPEPLASAPATPANPTEHLAPASLRPMDDAEALPRAGGIAATDITTTSATSSRPHARHRMMGQLNCNSWPWSIVYLDGRRLPGNTPFYGIRTAVGNHRLVFVNPELGMSKEVQVNVVAGSVKTVAVKLQPSGTFTAPNGANAGVDDAS